MHQKKEKHVFDKGIDKGKTFLTHYDTRYSYMFMRRKNVSSKHVFYGCVTFSKKSIIL